jgi:hypothetical protein
MGILESLANWLREQGEMEFSAFVVAARAAGLNPALWHKAKKAGLISAEIRNGVHYVKAV